ncbi:MAG TPA: tetratricopeptide repeat protein [Dissulfurispiraceae bacterium]|nr:tetratricopeptide repeat protein [Dissulfurispiraceae bacterium]
MLSGRGLSVTVKNQRSSYAYFLRGLSHGKLGNYQLAIEDLTKAIELDPYLAEANDSRGVELRRVIDDYNKMIKLDQSSEKPLT